MRLIFVFLTLMLLSPSSLAGEYDELYLKSADLTYKHYVNDGRDELIYPAVHTSELDFALDVRVFQFAYVKAGIMGETDQTQFRAVGLNYHLGIPLWRFVDVEYEHYSKHILDGVSSTLPGFALYDSVNVVIHLLPAKY